MLTIALIGGDGAGKTTVANEIIKSSELPMKYLYMGLSTRSSRYSLISSRLVQLLKKKHYQNGKKTAANSLPDEIPANHLEYEENKHGWIWNTARFLNRLAEGWYRQLISWIFQACGFIVIYDRHYFFDSVPDAPASSHPSLLLFDRLFYRLMNHFYPKPTLTIFLDAPSKLMFERKGEASPAYLNKQKRAFIQQGKKLDHFIRVDSSRPLEQVTGEVMCHIQDLYRLKYPRRARIS